jgi:hypothetical protein
MAGTTTPPKKVMTNLISRVLNTLSEPIKPLAPPTIAHASYISLY